MLSHDVAQQARDLMAQGRNAAALQVIVNALITNGFINASLCHIHYMAETAEGDAVTYAPSYEKDPITGVSTPVGPSEVVIYTPGFRSLPWLVSTVMHEYQHVIQFRKAKTPADFKEPKAKEDDEADEVEA